MVAEARLWGDVEITVRTWARAALPQLTGRVFFAGEGKALFPQIALFRVSGVDSEALIQFDVWARTKAQAAQVAADLASAADAVSGFRANGVQLKSTRVEGIDWLPDQESNMPRYVVQVTFAAWAFQ